MKTQLFEPVCIVRWTAPQNSPLLLALYTSKLKVDTDIPLHVTTPLLLVVFESMYWYPAV